MDDFATMTVPTKGLQALETLYIIATSKNLSTVKGRYEFLLASYSDFPSVYDKLKGAQADPDYPTWVQMACAQYLSMYPDRALQEYQISFVSDPNGFDLTGFYCDSLVNTTRRHCAQQMEEISALQRESAKVKRRIKVHSEIASALNELQSKCATSANYSTSKTALDALANSFG